MDWINWAETQAFGNQKIFFVKYGNMGDREAVSWEQAKELYDSGWHDLQWLHEAEEPAPIAINKIKSLELDKNFNGHYHSGAAMMKEMILKIIYDRLGASEYFEQTKNLSCSLCGYFCSNPHHHNNWFDTRQNIEDQKWKPATEWKPGMEKSVLMKWADGKTQWNGNIVMELEELKPDRYHTLLWKSLETKANTQQEKLQSDAVAFQNWTIEEGWEWSTSKRFKGEEKIWYKVGEEGHLSTAELYKLFKTGN